MAINLEDLVARVRLDTSGLSGGLSSAANTLQGAGQRMASAGGTLTKGVTLPLVGAGVAAVHLAADFDTTMRKVGIATGTATGPLKDLALQMGAETAFSAGEASEAMLELAKGGMTSAQIKAGALRSTMTLAAAGEIALGESATYVSNAMAMFNMEAKDAPGIATALAGAANASSASVQSLGQGLQQVGGIAASAGMTLQETVGTLSAFDAAGLKGSDAGTSLKAMLNTLIPTTDKATNAMRDLGLFTEEGGNAFLKANGDFEDMSTIAGRLKEALQGASEGQRNLALETIFGSDGMRAANALMNAGEDGIRRYTAAARDQKTTQELANASMEGMSGAIERAKGSLETAAVVMGTELAPVVEAVAGAVERGANAFAEMDSGTQKVVLSVAGAAAALGPLLVIAGKVTGAVGTLAGGLSRTTQRLGAVQSAARGAAGAAGIGLLVASTQMAEGGLRDLSVIGGTVMTGFAVGGPWGAALSFAALALNDLRDSLSSSKGATRGLTAEQEEFKRSLDQTTGALTKQSRELIRAKFAEDGVIDAAQLLGIKTRDLIDAATGHAGAQRRVNAELQQAKRGMILTANAGKMTDGVFRDVSTAMGLVEGSVGQARSEFRKSRSAIQAAGEVANETGFKMKGAGHDADWFSRQVARAFFDSAKNSRVGARQVANNAESVGKSRPHLEPYVKDVDAAMERAARAARAGAIRLSSNAREGTSTARPNLDPFAGELTRRMGDLAGTARAGGDRIGSSLGSGLVSGIGAYVSDAINAAANLVGQAIRAAENRAEAKSPSRRTYRLGRDLGRGLSGGLDASVGEVSRSMANLVAVPRAASLRARTGGLTPPTMPQSGRTELRPEFRVFIGDRELTDIVRVEMGSTLAPLTTLARQGAI